MHPHNESTEDEQTHEKQSWVRKLNCLILGCLHAASSFFIFEARTKLSCTRELTNSSHPKPITNLGEMLSIQNQR